MAWMGTTCFSLVFVSIYFRNDRKRSVNSFTVLHHTVFNRAVIINNNGTLNVILLNNDFYHTHVLNVSLSNVALKHRRANNDSS